MAQFDPDKQGNWGAELVKPFHEPVASLVKASPQEAMPTAATAEFVFGAPAGSVRAIQ
jgi:hypothetical protein